MTINKREVLENISDAVSRALLREAFLGAALVRLERVYIDEGDPNPLGIDTAAVDNRRMYFYLPWVATLTLGQLIGLVLHESAHYALLHVFRAADRQREVWNIACDAVINHGLKKHGYALPPDGVYLNWVTEEHSAEEVYAKLLEQQDGQNGKPKPKPGEGAGGWGNDILPATDEGTSEAEVAAVMEAVAKMAKQAGSNGAFMDRVLAGCLAPKVSWKEVLRTVLQTAFDRSDYSFRRGNRRFLAQNMYLPSLYKETLGMLVIGVDTSGSISPYILEQVAGEVTAIVQDCRPSRTVVVYCDAQVSHVETFLPDEPVVLSPKGGGGTAFKPVFDWVAANADEPVCALVYITDTYGNMAELEEPGYPVVWGLTEPVRGFTPPFGRTVEVYRWCSAYRLNFRR